MQINSCGVAGAQNVLFEVREQAVCAMWRMVWGNSPGQKFMVPQPEQGRFNCGSTSSTCQNSVSVLVRTPMRCKERARDGQGRGQSRECIVGEFTEAVRNSCAQPTADDKHCEHAVRASWGLARPPTLLFLPATLDVVMNVLKTRPFALAQNAVRIPSTQSLRRLPCIDRARLPT